MIETAMLCLALNIYHEARGESEVGQWAVAQVTLNRARQDPARVCEVVFAPRQFSWTNTLVEAPSFEVRRVRAQRFMPKETAAWNRAKRIAKASLEGIGKDVVGDATHYHATYVAPRWASSFDVVAQIGNHVFYR